MMKKTLCLLLLTGSILTQLKAQTLTVATYNIRNANQGDSVKGNGWGQRLPQIAGLIRTNNFEVFGTQEVLHHQLKDLLAALPGYGSIGVGRNDGKKKGEYAAIFFKTERLDTLSTGNFWLSPITDRPNKGWDAALPRICTWAHFKDKNSKLLFWYFNLHMDHKGVQARKNSAELVLRKIREMVNGEPVVLSGDFNVDQTSESYLTITRSGVLKDAYEVTGIRYAPNGTFNAFNPDLYTTSRIDHIFVSGGIRVNRYSILTNVYYSDFKDGDDVKAGDFPKEYSFKLSVAKTPSDHYPVKVEIEFAAH